MEAGLDQGGVLEMARLDQTGPLATCTVYSYSLSGCPMVQALNCS